MPLRCKICPEDWLILEGFFGDRMLFGGATENVASGLKHRIGGAQEICVGSADCMLDLLPVTCEDSKPDSQGLEGGNKCKLKPHRRRRQNSDYVGYRVQVLPAKGHVELARTPKGQVLSTYQE